MRICLLLALAAASLPFECRAEPLIFPSGYVPLSYVDYVTPADSNGYSLVVGEVTTGVAFSQLWTYLQTLPAVSDNQEYSSRSIELAPGLFFNNVLVPTSADRFGDYRDFGGAIYDPLTFSPGVPAPVTYYNAIPGTYSSFPENIIPMSRFLDPFAFRIGPADNSASPTPEPGGVALIIVGLIVVLLSRKYQTRAY